MIKHKINQEIAQLVFFQKQEKYISLCAQSWSILTMANKTEADDEDIRILNMNFGIFIYYLDRSWQLMYNYLTPTSTTGWRNPSYRAKDISRRLEKIITAEQAA